jgi:Rrf2 family protein
MATERPGHTCPLWGCISRHHISVAILQHITRLPPAMKLSKRGEYGLRAMIDIGIAQELGRELIPIREISEHEDIPIKFLEAILLELKEAGYLDSKRGKHGGYFLAMPMRKIKIGDVVRRIEGPLAPIGCASVTAYQPCSCPDEEHCGLRLLMVDVRNAIANILDRYTLAEVVEVTMKKFRRDRIELPFMLKEESKR